MFDDLRIDSSPGTALQMRDYLAQLHAERAFASLQGSAATAYIADLDGEIAAADHAYIGAVVTEIATLRAELFGAQVG